MSEQEEVVTAVAEPRGAPPHDPPPGPHPGPPPGDGEGEELDIGRFIGALDRGKYFIALLVLCCTVAGNLYVKNQTPKYRAEMEMVIAQGNAQVSEELTDLTIFQLLADTGRRSTADPDSQAAILTSRQLAKEAVRRLTLHTSPLFQPEPRPQEQEDAAEDETLLGTIRQKAGGIFATMTASLGLSGGEAAADDSPGGGPAAARRWAATEDPPEKVVRALADKYRANIAVRQGSAERLLKVSYVSEDPVFAALAANTTAELYIERQKEAQQHASESSSHWLQNEVAQARQRLLDAEKALERFRQQTGISDRVSQSVPAQRLSNLKSSVVEIRAEVQDLKARRERVRLLRENGAGVSVAGPLLESEILRELRNERLRIERSIETLRGRFREAHPKMRAAKRDLANVNDRIQTEVANFQNDLERQLHATKQRIASLKEEIASLEDEVDRLRVSEGQMRALESEVQANREHYRTLLQELKKSDLQERRDGGSQAVVINEATVPGKPFAPNPPVVVAASFMMSALAGIAIVLGLELMQKGVRRLSDLDQRNGVEPVGVIPRLRLKKNQSPEDYLLADVTTPYAESVRNLRTGLSLLVRSQSLGCVLVTSALNDEGKSTVTKALAAQAADAGQKAIVVDCDFRGGRAEADSVPGVADYLRGDASLDHAITRLPGTGADWLGAGCNCRYPDEILGSAEFPKFLKELERRYDHVFLDGTALLIETDILRRANLANIVLLLVRWGATTSEAVDLAVQRLHEAGAQRLTGALTRVDLKLYGKYESGAYKALTQIPGPAQPALLGAQRDPGRARFRLFG